MKKNSIHIVRDNGLSIEEELNDQEMSLKVNKRKKKFHILFHSASGEKTHITII